MTPFFICLWTSLIIVFCSFPPIGCPHNVFARDNVKRKRIMQLKRNDLLSNSSRHVLNFSWRCTCKPSRAPLESECEKRKKQMLLLQTEKEFISFNEITSSVLTKCCKSIRVMDCCDLSVVRVVLLSIRSCWITGSGLVCHSNLYHCRLLKWGYTLGSGGREADIPALRCWLA